MSDDLISRRSILNKINEWSNKLSCENGKQFTLAEFEHIVANEPTAYDVDKVIKQLKQQAEQYRMRGFDIEQKGFSNIADKYYGKQCSYEHAIEIVKYGGAAND